MSNRVLGTGLYLRLCDTAGRRLSSALWPKRGHRDVRLSRLQPSCTHINNPFAVGNRLTQQGAPVVQDVRFTVIEVDKRGTTREDLCARKGRLGTTCQAKVREAEYTVTWLPRRGFRVPLRFISGVRTFIGART